MFTGQTKEEIWKDIHGYEGLYQISNLGRVKSLSRQVRGTIKRITSDRIMVANMGSTGYREVSLSRNGKRAVKKIHRLFAIAFIANPENKPCINHKDGNKLNNDIENLEWCTYSENVRHALKTGLIKPLGRESHPRCKITEADVASIRSNNCKLKRKELALKYKISIGAIDNILGNRTWVTKAGELLNERSGK